MIRMKQKRLAALVMVPLVVAFLPRVARADIPVEAKIYGFLNAQLEAVWASGGATPYRPAGRVADGNSRLGFTGSIELFPQTKVLWQIEGALNFEQGGANDQGLFNTIVSRNSFVGVDDERFGRVVVGYNDSAYRTLVGSAAGFGGNLGLTKFGLDLWNNTDAQVSSNANSVFGRGESRYKNSVHYLSPDWKGFRIAGSYSFDELIPNGGTRDRFSVGALFKWGGFSIGAGFDYQRNTGVDVDKLMQGFGLMTHAENDVATYFYKALVSYEFSTKTYLGIGVERSNYGYANFVPPTPANPYASIETGVMSQFGMMASVAQGIGDHLSLMASFGKLGNLAGSIHGAATDFSAMQFSGGAKYAFNERFAAYVYYTQIENSAQQTVNLGQASLYTNKVGTADAYLSPGNSPRALALGVIARF